MLRRLKRWPSGLVHYVPGSIKNWLTVLFLGVVLLDIALAYMYVVPSLEARLVHQKLNDLSASSGLVTSTIAGASQISETGQSTFNLNQAAQFIDTQINARIVVIDGRTLRPLADSRPGLPFDVARYPVVRETLATSKKTVAETSVDGTRYATVAVYVLIDSYPGAVLISAPLTDLQRAVRQVQQRILLAGMLAIFATVVAGYLASYFIARRLKRIERGALSFASGDFSRPVRPGPADEIGQLATTFNMMGVRLREAFSQIAREKENVEVLLYDLAEGVIGARADGTTAIANPAAETLLGMTLTPDLPLPDVLPPDIAHTFAETQADGEDRTVVVEQGDRSLEVSVYRVGREAGREAEVRDIVVLRDITEQARLDQARRDFIATASHELKTPLFSLSGFMELLDEGDLDSQTEGEFLGLMRQQVDRLMELSLSLLDLSQVDSGAVRLEPADADLTILAHAVAAEFRPEAETRQVEVEVTGPDELPVVIDERRVTQVLRALLDNALKFSPPGGHVRVKLDGSTDEVSLTVTDDGPGISHDELSRVFERFYRGHGGQAGTGLGLSITKDLIELMGGSVEIVTSPGQGASFVVRVPRVQGETEESLTQGMTEVNARGARINTRRRY